MREQGEIVKIVDDIAYVQMVMGDQCKGCNLCSAFGDNSKILEVRNELEAKIGDNVTVEISPKRVVGHSLLVFVLPLCFLIAGYFVGIFLSWPKGWSTETRGIGAGMIFFMLSWCLVLLYNYYFSRKGQHSAEIIGYSQRKLQTE